MKTKRRVRSEQWLWRHAAVLLFVFLIFGSTQIARAQNAEKTASSDPLTGKYEGMIKSSPGIDSRLTLEVTNELGKVSGRLVTPQGSTPITKGKFKAGNLALKLGQGKTASTFTARLQDDKIIGNWTEGKKRHAVELKKVLPVAAETPAGVPAPVTPVAPPADPPTTAPAAPESVAMTGEWDGLADAQGQGIPFLLILKVEGEKVTGESSSSLGQATISNGTFKDGKLAFQLDAANGVIVMSAVLKDGGLVGDFDYAGQAQGRWVAKKRNP